MAAHEQILADARERRGLPPSEKGAPLQGRRQSDDSLVRRRGRAFNAGYFSTAQRYAWKLCCQKPWQVGDWATLLRIAYVRLRVGDYSDPSWDGPTALSAIE